LQALVEVALGEEPLANNASHRHLLRFRTCHFAAQAGNP
jgi:hypothetical protein